MNITSQHATLSMPSSYLPHNPHKAAALRDEPLAADDAASIININSFKLIKSEVEHSGRVESPVSRRGVSYCGGQGGLTGALSAPTLES